MEPIVVPAAEYAFIMGKTTDFDVRRHIAGLSEPKDVRAFGRTLELRQDWEEIKEAHMLLVLRDKANQNPDIKALLLDTGKARIIEGNRHGDREWGVDEFTGEGANKLGKAWDKLRDTFNRELKLRRDIENTREKFARDMTLNFG